MHAGTYGVLGRPWLVPEQPGPKAPGAFGLELPPQLFGLRPSVPRLRYLEPALDAPRFPPEVLGREEGTPNSSMAVSGNIG
jgi:hypothetical protein